MVSHCKLILIGLFLFNSHIASSKESGIRTVDHLQWTPLNPLRGEASPQAADLWGDRQTSGSTGFLVKFKPGFISPPHIHNVSYRGVVIKGLVHNDDPDAQNMWLPTGSFWTQPAGEAHITAAKDKENIAYIEIDSGPYLVHPKSQAFDNGERAVNVDQSNLVWLDANDIKWIDAQQDVQRAFLWGSTSNGQLNGSFIKLPAGFEGQLKSEGSIFHAVIIQGYLKHVKQKSTLAPGSYFSHTREGEHIEVVDDEVVIYVRTNSKLQILSSKK
ncbi:DUF4437 domain-containing protein [Pseudoalteromonas sp. SMS1]|uniref:DUF4437 domain-containing protein n=1 Tax=Pseudoalteromonas sp. SMS1 TaxID=2908894 RepID=UPI001F21FCF6|nr:DUF4437 domain-containing protein [Pseudoalteromonas sp. SMS1]MCF2860163.1 DUF4437 domain-containing protein [Pseudoalteromonas sp. SMS1]